MRLWNSLRRRRPDVELEEELAAHLEFQVADNIRAGMGPEEALRRARLKLGAIEPAKEAYRDRFGVPLIETALQDFRYAARGLWRSRGFTAVVILTLAVGIGANSAIFSIFDAVLLRMVPVDHPEQLMFVDTNAVESGSFRISRSITRGDIAALQRATLVSGLAAFRGESRLHVTVNGAEPESVAGQLVSPGYFNLLGVEARLGRTIGLGDDTADSRVVVLRYGYWQEKFGADPRVIGQRITVNRIPCVIVGVSAPEFHGLVADTEAQIFLPDAMEPQITSGRISSDLPKRDDAIGTTVARLRPGTLPGKAAAELTALFRANLRVDAERSSLSMELTPASHGLSFVRQRYSEPLRVLFGVVALVMLIACTNIANLMLARAGARRREFAIRLSLGCARWRMIRLLMTESLLLASGGLIAGLILSAWARTMLVRLMVSEGAVVPLEWNGKVLAFTAGISLLNAILFGLWPAWQSTRPDPARSARRAPSARFLAIDRWMVAGQVALSLTLLVGAALFLTTFRNLSHANLGMNTHGLATVTIDTELAGYSGESGMRFLEEARRRVAAIPGVESAMLMRSALFTGHVSFTSLFVPGYAPRPGEDLNRLWILNNASTPGLFPAVGIPLVGGRDFSESDGPGAPPVTIVNETLARHFFGTTNVVGRRVGWTRGNANVEIIGVVRDFHYFGAHEQPQDVLFRPFAQDNGSEATLIFRTSAPPNTVFGAVRSALLSLDPQLPVYGFSTVDDRVASTFPQERLLAVLCTLFGALALALAAIGLYGVCAYGVHQRVQEMGIRMALGAPREAILRMVLTETAFFVAGGAAAGLVLSLWASRWIRSLLYGVTPADPAALAAALLVLSTCSLIAAYLPARRAARVDPMVALRHE